VRGYPKGLEEIVIRALSTEPDARFATALQLRQALEKWLASSGPPIGAQQISLLLEERCGAELGARMSALSVTQPAMPAPPAPASNPALSSGPQTAYDSNSTMEVDRRAPPHRQPRRGGLGVASTMTAVLVGVVLGLAVLVFVRKVRREHRMAAEMAMFDAAAAHHAVPAPAASLVPSSTLDAATIAIGDVDDDDAPPGTDAAPSEVTLHVPAGARLFVDGRQLPAGTESVPRPDSGVVTVLVKAEAHEDAVVEIRPTSPDQIDVPMVDKPKPKPRSNVPPPDPASTIAMPPNPYE